MEGKGACGRIPEALRRWISILGASQSGRLSTTFVELLLGALMEDRGWIAAAFLAIGARRSWKAYFWAIEKGKLRLLAPIRALCSIAAEATAGERCRVFAIDDTFIPRSTDKAPGSVVTHQHTKKQNRPEYMPGQTLVVLAAVVRGDSFERAVPLAASLPFAKGNGGKIRSAMVMIRAISGAFPGPKTLVADAWYMRANLIGTALRFGFRCVGQVRGDTVPYEAPPSRLPGTKGRPRKKGARIDPESLPLTAPIGAIPLWSGRTMRWRTAVCLAGFLGLRKVRAVWAEMMDPDEPGRWTKPRLLISTDPTMSALEILRVSARRWTIESLFQALKDGGGLHEMWMQGRRALIRWIHVRLAAMALAQMITLRLGSDILGALKRMGWRKALRPTAGMVRIALPMLFGGDAIHALWNPKSREFGAPKRSTEPILLPPV